MNGDLDGRVVLVTGATDGIGRLTAERLARRGARVLAHGRSQDKIDATLERIRALDAEVRARLMALFDSLS